MARTTHVKRAQQRYATVPVKDPETGEIKKTPVMKKVTDRKTGQVTEVQKTTKKGKPVFMTVTMQDRNSPLPPYTCDSCHEPIKVGTPYKHVTPKSGPYGGHKRTRHESCPSWQIWELSNSWSARIAQATHGFDISTAESADDVTSALESVAEEIESLAEESREAASNIEDGFGHATSVSEEAEQRAEDLDTWAEEIKNVDVPEFPEPEEIDCDDCEGTGKVDNPAYDPDDEESEEDEEIECDTCDGSGQVTPEEPTEEQIEEWRSEVEDACSIVDESPV